MDWNVKLKERKPASGSLVSGNFASMTITSWCGVGRQESVWEDLATTSELYDGCLGKHLVCARV